MQNSVFKAYEGKPAFRDMQQAISSASLSALYDQQMTRLINASGGQWRLKTIAANIIYKCTIAPDKEGRLKGMIKG